MIVSNFGILTEDMLIIGHRGAAGLAAENTVEAMRTGIASGADILEFDVKMTRDKQLLVIHDSTLLRTHKKQHIIRWSTHDSIKIATEKGHKIATLEEVLDLFYGKVLLNLEIKSSGAAKYIVELLHTKYIQKPSDWENILISSYKPSELIKVRNASKDAELSLIHKRNPFNFMFYQRRLNLTAVGFHRLYVNTLCVEVAKQLGIFTYVYTVNRPDAAIALSRQGIDGVVTDNPLLMKNIKSRV